MERLTPENMDPTKKYEMVAHYSCKRFENAKNRTYGIRVIDINLVPDNVVEGDYYKSFARKELIENGPTKNCDCKILSYFILKLDKQV